MPSSSAVARIRPSSATRAGTPIQQAVRPRIRRSSPARAAFRPSACPSARASSRRRAPPVRRTSRAVRADVRSARPSVPPSSRRSSSASPRPRQRRAPLLSIFCCLLQGACHGDAPHGLQGVTGLLSEEPRSFEAGGRSGLVAGRLGDELGLQIVGTDELLADVGLRVKTGPVEGEAGAREHVTALARLDERRRGERSLFAGEIHERPVERACGEIALRTVPLRLRGQASPLVRRQAISGASHGEIARRAAHELDGELSLRAGAVHLERRRDGERGDGHRRGRGSGRRGRAPLPFAAARHEEDSTEVPSLHGACGTTKQRRRVRRLRSPEMAACGVFPSGCWLHGPLSGTRAPCALTCVPFASPQPSSPSRRCRGSSPRPARPARDRPIP